MSRNLEAMLREALRREDALRAEVAALRRRVREVRMALLNGKSLAYRVLPLLDLRKPLRPVARRGRKAT